MCPMKWQLNQTGDTNSTALINTNLDSTIGDSNNVMQTQKNSNSVSNVYETMVSNKEIDAQRKVQILKCGVDLVPGFKIKYKTRDFDVPEQFGECQECKLLVQKPTLGSLRKHR